MRRIYILLLLASLIGINKNECRAQAPDLLWLKGVGSTSSEWAEGISIDDSGFVYIVGKFKGNADFDPDTSSVVSMQSNGGWDAFYAKYSATGDLIWVYQIGSIAEESCYDLQLDVTGNIWLTGTFESTCDFNSGPGTFFMSSTGAGDIFYLKLNHSGQFIWAGKVGSSNYDYCKDFLLDNFGNVYAAGYFAGASIDLDPGPGDSIISSNGNYYTYIHKLDSGGNLIWGRTIQSTYACFAFAVELDGFNNVFISGTFEGVVDFDPGAGLAIDSTSGPNSDGFVLKLNANGDFLWAKKIGGNNADDHIYALAIDGNDDIYLTGAFADTVDFDPGPSSFNMVSAGLADMFLLKLTNAGTFEYALRMGGEEHDEGEELLIGPNNQVYLSGWISDTVDMDPGAGSEIFTSLGDLDVFTSSYQSDGTYNWSLQTGGAFGEYPRGLVHDGNGGIYMAGSYGSLILTCDSMQIMNNGNLGTSDMYFSKIFDIGTGMPEQEFHNRLKVYPNPTNGHLVIDAGSNQSNSVISVNDLSGKTIEKHNFSKGDQLILNLENLDPGMYLVVMDTDLFRVVQRVVLLD